MNIKKIAIILVIIIVVAIISYRIRSNMVNSPLLIPTISDGATKYQFDKGQIALAPINGGLEYTFSFWIYISNWSYKFGLEKIIAFWKGTQSSQSLEQACKAISDQSAYQTTSQESEETDEPTSIKETCKDCQLGNLLEGFESSSTSGKLTGIYFSLDKNDNSLVVTQSLINGKHTSLKIKNLPIQKWLNITIILQLRNLDVFINGKLKGSKRLSTLPTYQEGDLVINPDGGFDGYISKFQYFNRKIKSSEIRNLFHKGPKNWNPLSNNNAGKEVATTLSSIGSNFNDPSSLVTGLQTAASNLSKKVVDDKYKIGHLCHTDDDCKTGLSCVQGKCGFEPQSRQVGKTCYSNSDCKIGLNCNNHGTDKLNQDQIDDLTKIGIPVDDDSSFNSALGNKPFTCIYPQ